MRLVLQYRARTASNPIRWLVGSLMAYTAAVVLCVVWVVAHTAMGMSWYDSNWMTPFWKESRIFGTPYVLWILPVLGSAMLLMGVCRGAMRRDGTFFVVVVAAGALAFALPVIGTFIIGILSMALQTV